MGPPLDFSLWHAKLAPLEPLDGARDLLARLGVLLELVVEIAFPGPRLSRLAQRLRDEIPEIFGEPPRDGSDPVVRQRINEAVQILPSQNRPPLASAWRPMVPRRRARMQLAAARRRTAGHPAGATAGRT